MLSLSTALIAICRKTFVETPCMLVFAAAYNLINRFLELKTDLTLTELMSDKLNLFILYHVNQQQVNSTNLFPRFPILNSSSSRILESCAPSTFER